MENVISVIVVLVFAGILFRKRLAPFFRGRKKTDKPSVVDPSSGDAAALPDKAKGCVYFSVSVVDAGGYLNTGELSDAIDAKLHKELDIIYRKYTGTFIGLDVVTNDDLLLFLIRWHT